MMICCSTSPRSLISIVNHFSFGSGSEAIRRSLELFLVCHRYPFLMQHLTVRLKLMPDRATRDRLLSFIADVNECCNWMSVEAWTAQTFRRLAKRSS